MSKSWICNDCGSEFVSECSTACLQCGSPDVSSIVRDSQKILPDVKSDDRVIKDILLELCQETYETSFKSVEWDTLIDQAIQKLKPFLKEEAMPVFNDEEIVCYRLSHVSIGKEIVCKKCITNEELQNLEADDIVTQDEIADDELYFCDRCKQRID